MPDEPTTSPAPEPAAGSPDAPETTARTQPGAVANTAADVGRVAEPAYGPDARQERANDAGPAAEDAPAADAGRVAEPAYGPDARQERANDAGPAAEDAPAADAGDGAAADPAVEAERLARERRERAEIEALRRREARQAASQRRLRVILPILLVLVALVYAFTTNYIPSKSMLPTLKPGDHILTVRTWLAYPRGAMPVRGDIVVFRQPDALTQQDGGVEPGTRPKLGLFKAEGDPLLIKRVAAVAGQTVLIWDDQLYIDGKPVKPDHGIIEYSGDYDPDQRYGVGAPLKLGPNEVYVLGDNHDSSEDSRYYGPIKQRDIVGRFVRVLWNDGAGDAEADTAGSEH